MQKRYASVATGGTFDIIHKGHERLLRTAFAVSDMVIIGLTNDAMVARMAKSTQNDYRGRLANLTSFLEDTFPGAAFRISMLDDDFGPAALEEGVGALVASEETAHKIQRLNEMRAARGLSHAEIVIVPMVMAGDGQRISTSRIRRSEIDASGRIL